MPDNITLADIYRELQEFREEMKDTYVTQDRFKPVEKIVYGATTLVLMTFAGALLAQVVKANF